MGSRLKGIAARKGGTWIGDVAVAFHYAVDRAAAWVDHFEAVAQRVTGLANSAFGVGAVDQRDRRLKSIDIPAADLLHC